MNKHHTFLIMICGVMLSGCYGPFLGKLSGAHNRDIDNMRLAPLPAGMGRPDRNAPQEYLQGWDDGCKTGLSTMNLGAYKGFYQYTMSPELYSNANYYKAWKDSYTYCRQYSFKWTMEPLDRQYDKTKICIIC